MSLEICVLGSGSGGNSTVVRSPWGCFLIDAGFGPRVTAQRLAGTGVEMEHVQAIVLSHLDTDHFKTHWFNTIARWGIRVFCHAGKIRQLLGSPEAREWAQRHGEQTLMPLVSGFDGEGFEPIKGVRVEPVELAHDEAGSHGFVISCGGCQVGYATDLGRVPGTLVERFCGVDVVMLEANYDAEMERASDRPVFLKQRIMGGKGHLSNEQALAAVRAILDRTQERHGAARLPRHIVLMHRSRQCNCPELVERLFGADERIKPVLTLAHQAERTGWLRVRGERAAGMQMALGF
jgi:phosphoribosyl 1,2-cyclic phosphodiesterase